MEEGGVVDGGYWGVLAARGCGGGGKREEGGDDEGEEGGGEEEKGHCGLVVSKRVWGWR